MQWINASERLPEATSGWAKQIVLKWEFEPIEGEKNMQLRTTTVNAFLDLVKTGIPKLTKMQWLDESSPRLQEAAEWVRVEDGLPDEGEDVLGVHVEAGGIQIVWYDHEEKRWETIDLDPLHTLLITHWRPLPAPPRPNQTMK